MAHLFRLARKHWPRLIDIYRVRIWSGHHDLQSLQQMASLVSLASMIVAWRMTKAEVLRYAIDFALRRSRKIVRGLKERLTEDERYAVADHAVAQLKWRPVAAK